MVGASGFEPPTSWSRTKDNFIDSVSLKFYFTGFLRAKLDPNTDPISPVLADSVHRLHPEWVLILLGTPVYLMISPEAAKARYLEEPFLLAARHASRTAREGTHSEICNKIVSSSPVSCASVS